MLAQLLVAQVDKKWVVGYSPSILQFDIDTTYNYPVDTPNIMAILTTAANICDDSGQVQFFSNGFYLFDRFGDSIESGSGFHPPKLTAFYDGVSNSSQAALILPKSNGLYYYFYYSMSDSAYSHNQPFDLLYYSVVDMNANNGRGKVISKNKILLQGQPLSPYGLTACRHANGRDWWLVMPQFHINAYFIFNVTSDTITSHSYRSISACYFGNPTPHGQCAFSNDGNYFADERTLTHIKDKDLIAFQYCDPAGNVTQEANPNGAVENIAGIFNDSKTILGMMPHPERVVDAQLHSGTDGVPLFKSIVEALH